MADNFEVFLARYEEREKWNEKRDKKHDKMHEDIYGYIKKQNEVLYNPDTGVFKRMDDMKDDTTAVENRVDNVEKFQSNQKKVYFTMITAVIGSIFVSLRTWFASLFNIGKG